MVIPGFLGGFSDADEGTSRGRKLSAVNDVAINAAIRRWRQVLLPEWLALDCDETWTSIERSGQVFVSQEH